MRLFVAAALPADLVDRLDAALGARDPALRWVPPEQWHVTLSFYGEVPDGVVPRLVERLERATGRATPMSLSLQGAGTFPRQAARARVMWLGVTGEVDALSRLADRCAAAARREGISVEERSFRPHLTLARARRGAADLRDLLRPIAGFAAGPWQVAAVRLVHSTLGAQVRHETLREFALGDH
jgi:2'-5' RNA ligase